VRHAIFDQLLRLPM